MAINNSLCEELPFATLTNDSFHSTICNLTSFNSYYYNLEYNPFATHDKYDNFLCTDEFYLRNIFIYIPKCKYIFLDNINLPSNNTLTISHVNIRSIPKNIQDFKDNIIQYIS